MLGGGSGFILLSFNPHLYTMNSRTMEDPTRPNFTMETRLISKGSETVDYIPKLNTPISFCCSSDSLLLSRREGRCGKAEETCRDISIRTNTQPQYQLASSIPKGIQGFRIPGQLCQSWPPHPGFVSVSITVFLVLPTDS